MKIKKQSLHALRFNSKPLSALAQNEKEITVETFRIDYFIGTPKVEKLSLQPIS